MVSAMASFLSIHPNPPITLNFNSTRKTITSHSLSSTPNSSLMQVPYNLKEEQTRFFHKLPSGLNMEVIFQKGVTKDPTVEKLKTRNPPPLVFVHGSFHAAWCWAVHWLPFFSGVGYDCYAISLLGQLLSNPNMSESNSKAESAFESLSFMLGSIPLSISSSQSPASVLLHDPTIAKQISYKLKQPDSGAGDNDLCRWLYDTFQSSDPTLQLVVLKFLPIIGGIYLSRASLRKSLAGFEAILLAIYAHETTSRRGQPITVNVPDLSHPSIYHEVPITNSSTELNLAFLSQSLEPYGTIRSTKRARIVGVALELYHSKISLMPVSSLIDFCEFCVIWAGQDGEMFKEGAEDGEKGDSNEDLGDGGEGGASTSEDGVSNNVSAKQSEEKDGRIPLPWELLQPVLRILSHCLLGPNKSKELQDVACAASRSLYARALHDVNPQAILATGSLLRLGKMAIDTTQEPDPTEISDVMNPLITL